MGIVQLATRCLLRKNIDAAVGQCRVDTSGIDQIVSHTVELSADADIVTSCARNVRDDCSFIVDEGIQKAALANICTTVERHAGDINGYGAVRKSLDQFTDGCDKFCRLSADSFQRYKLEYPLQRSRDRPRAQTASPGCRFVPNSTDRRNHQPVGSKRRSVALPM